MSTRQLRSKAPKFEPGISPVNMDAAAKMLKDLSYNGPVTLSYDDTELEKALSVYEKSEEFIQVIGKVGEPMDVCRTANLDAVFADATIVKASKVCARLSTGYNTWLISDLAACMGPRDSLAQSSPACSCSCPEERQGKGRRPYATSHQGL